ncbi:MAG: DMT family transporter [Candidatus Heimdallarchaeota archaeon]|nr:DMT family transporter [Candidatus Heimdallarchaeota archaeon]MCK4255192.1 DMT family transporter [Candidatus Heimdallarchaeota archaeon]
MEHNEENEKSKFQLILPFLLLLIAVVAVSFSAIIVVELNVTYGVKYEVTAMYRTLFAGIGALLLSFRKKKINWIIQKSTLRKTHWYVLAGLLLAIHFASWFVSLGFTSIVISTTLVDTVPIFLAVFGYIFFKEKINYFGMIGIGLAVMGGVLLAFSSSNGSTAQSNSLLGVVLSLIGALTVTFYFLIGKKVLQNAPLWPYFAFVNLSSAFFLFIYCLIYNKFENFELFVFPLIVFVLFILSAVGPSLIGHATYNYSLKKLPAFVVGVAILGEPIGATILAMFFSNQFPAPLTILYAGTILTGVIITSFSPKIKTNILKRKEKEKPLDPRDV